MQPPIIEVSSATFSIETGQIIIINVGVGVQIKEGPN